MMDGSRHQWFHHRWPCPAQNKNKNKNKNMNKGKNNIMYKTNKHEREKFSLKRGKTCMRQNKKRRKRRKRRKEEKKRKKNSRTDRQTESENVLYSGEGRRKEERPARRGVRALADAGTTASVWPICTSFPAPGAPSADWRTPSA